MIRKIIKINEEKCDGCGACVKACHEGAIGLVNGKAKLLRDDYCDGLGDCLPSCHAKAITFEEREALPYDEKAVIAKSGNNLNSSCLGHKIESFKNNHEENTENEVYANSVLKSKLSQWPIQIKLVPTNASFFEGANLLIAADCTAFAYGNFHNEFIKNHITLIGCPKLDAVDYKEKLTEILKLNNIKSLTIVKMEVPCCNGIEKACIEALKSSQNFIPWQTITITRDGKKITNI